MDPKRRRCILPSYITLGVANHNLDHVDKEDMQLLLNLYNHFPSRCLGELLRYCFNVTEANNSEYIPAKIDWEYLDKYTCKWYDLNPKLKGKHS